VLLLLGSLTRSLAQEISLPASARPLAATLGDDLPDGGREDALLCYHQGSTYYVKQPHPTSGSINPLFQSITPGSSGHMNAFELRLYNTFPGNLRHEGLLQLTVHRRAGLMPGVFEQMVVVSTDTVDTGVLRIPLSAPFEFAQGEEFFLGMSYLPAASLDTIAYVTAGLGSYTGHSFFLQNGQVVWWGAPDGTLFGDMHFCADVWLDTQQAYLQFPWNRLDLGRGRADQPLELVLPVLNQGTAPLTVSSTISGAGWSARLRGPDSLMPPDTLFLTVNWDGPPTDSTGTGALTLSTNATNNPVRTIPLRAASSTADVLLADWDEWPTGVEQLVDSSDSEHTWRRVQGLNRPRTFMGHDSPLQGQSCRDVLFLRGLRLQENATLQLRWSQYRRHSSGMREHSFVWRPAGTEEWHVLADHDLARDPWLGPADEWWTTPWLEWNVPAGGEFDVGLLYGGDGAYDRWYVDDLELRVEGSLAAPELSVSHCGGFLKLEWESIPGATHYCVERTDCQPPQVQGWTTDTQWPLGREQRRGAGCYRVSAWNNRPALVED
jgi:hypothetical protein